MTREAFNRLLKRHKWCKTQPWKRHVKAGGTRQIKMSKKLSVVPEQLLIATE